MVSSEGLTGEDPRPSSLFVGRLQSLTGCWSEASFSSSQCGPLRGAAQNTIAGFPQNEQERVRRYPKRKSLRFCNLVLEGISHPSPLPHPFFFFPPRFFWGYVPFFKSLLNWLQYCLCRMPFYFFGLKAYRILAPRSGIKPTTPALEGKS